MKVRRLQVIFEELRLPRRSDLWLGTPRKDVRGGLCRAGPQTRRGLTELY